VGVHTQAWVVARSGGVRTGGPLRPMPRSPHSKSTSPRTRGRRLGQTPQPAPRKGRLALHNRDRSHQAQAPIPRALDRASLFRRPQLFDLARLVPARRGLYWVQLTARRSKALLWMGVGRVVMVKGMSG